MSSIIPQSTWAAVLLILARSSGANASVIFTANYTSRVLPLAYQSQGIAWSEWISLFTLCLAPLLAHVLAGVSEPSVLSRRRPRWYDRICHFNPTSILWRYSAVVDRRLRARVWTASEMASVNADFWTPHGWDGSDGMREASRPYAVVTPEVAHVQVFSSSAVKSVIVTLQGVQSLYVLVTGVTGGIFGGTLALDSIFGPIAVFGLLRLCAAFWLTDDYAYSYPEEGNENENDGREAGEEGPRKVQHSSSSMELTAPLVAGGGASQTGFLPPGRPPANSGLRPVDNWRSWTFCILYLFSIAFLWVICVLYMLPWKNSTTLTATTFVLGLFYLIFLSASLVIYTWYLVFRRQRSTTIIPCISAAWYKVYTGILLAMALLLLVIASVETRRTPCGSFTTWPPFTDMDVQLCPGLFPVQSGSATNPFGVATKDPATQLNGTALGPSQFVVVGFDGYCQGTTAGANIVVVPVNSSAEG